MNLVEVCDTQNEIIQMQSDLINRLSMELAQLEEINDSEEGLEWQQ